MIQTPDSRQALAAQYHDATNLRARQQIYPTVNGRNPWHRWVFEQLVIPAGGRLLELGCGPGALWVENDERLPADWSVTLTDRSPGMVAEAQRSLAHTGHPFAFAVADAEAIPFPDGSFDAVVANHMLYHVPDKPRAFVETRRVLRPGGRLYAATNGKAATISRPDLPEMGDLVGMFDPELPKLAVRLGPFLERIGPQSFSLENGAGQLQPHFRRVSLRMSGGGDTLLDDADRIVTYLTSGTYQTILVGERLAAFRAFVEGVMRDKGAVRFTKGVGMFVAIR